MMQRCRELELCHSSSCSSSSLGLSPTLSTAIISARRESTFISEQHRDPLVLFFSVQVSLQAIYHVTHANVNSLNGLFTIKQSSVLYVAKENSTFMPFCDTLRSSWSHQVNV